jgi:uncharacterized protein (DUF885 family)
MKILRTAVLGIFIGLGLLVGCKKSDIALPKSEANIDSIASKYYEGYLKMYPLEATMQGDSRYNDVLTNNISSEFISKEIAYYNETQKKLQTLDYDALSDDQKTVYDVLDYTLKDKIERYAYHPELMPFSQFEGLPLDFPLLGSAEGNQPFKTTQDYDNWLKRIDAFVIWMNTAEKNFREGMKQNVVLPKKLVVKMIPQMHSEEIITEDFDKNIFYGPIKKMPKNFSAKDKEKYKILYQEAISSKIIPAYQKMGDFLEKEYLPKARNTDGINALPNGKNIYEYYAKSWTTTNKTPEEINKIGLQQVAMLRAEMEKVKTQLGFKGSLEEFLTSLKTDKKAMPFKTPEEVIAAFNGVLKKIEPKLPTMFTKFPKTPFEIRRTEKFREASASAEYRQGSADGKRPGIFYTPIPNATKYNVTNGFESLFLHEAIPGHHYQISLQQENMEIPKFMRFGWFGAYGEGWAHYCETLGPEFGLYTDPYQKMGYLSDQMLRAVRLVVDTEIHTGKMTREEAIKYYLSNISDSEEGATAAIERYMAIPGQALGYKIGSLKFLELRAKYQKQLGKKFSLAKFHDEVLNQGCLPLSVLDRKMELWAKKQ